MSMQITKDGIFNMRLDSEILSIGLRKNKSNKVNSPGMVECSGVIGIEGVLQKLTPLIRTLRITTSFPYPQLFVESDVVILCTASNIYEYINEALVLKLTTTSGSTWSLISVGEFIYMSNGAVAVIRDPISKEFSISTQPTAMCICNYNGQVIIGAPNAGYNLGDI